MTRFSRLVHQVSGKVPSAPDWAGETDQPPMDIFEDETVVQVEIEVPGMNGRELTVRLDQDRLNIEGFKHSGSDSDCLRYICVEREYGVFRRVVELPVSVDASGVTAALNNGVLKIRLPKVQERRRAVVDVPVEE